MRICKQRRKKDKDHAIKKTIPLPEMEHDVLAKMEHNVKENWKELEEEQPKETIPITDGEHEIEEEKRATENNQPKEAVAMAEREKQETMRLSKRRRKKDKEHSRLPPKNYYLLLMVLPRN